MRGRERRRKGGKRQTETAIQKERWRQREREWRRVIGELISHHRKDIWI